MISILTGTLPLVACSLKEQHGALLGPQVVDPQRAGMDPLCFLLKAASMDATAEKAQQEPAIGKV